MSCSCVPERRPELAVSTIGFRGGTLAASAAALTPSARAAARRAEARMVDCPFLEGRRRGRSSGDPAANRVDGGGGERSADERHLHALARREAPLDLQEEEAVVGVVRQDALQV